MIELRNERGGILALSAMIVPAFLLLVALVLDAGTWYTHKQTLQNRADAGALAAGVEYLPQLSDCAANASPTGPAAEAIADRARQYAGDTGTPGAFNKTVNKQSEVTVTVSNPCEVHASGDPISPSGGIWTDVVVRETNLGTLAGMFGLNLASITARARVEVQQLVGVTSRSASLPFVYESGDQVDCVWAQFVDATTGDPNDVTLVDASSPVVELMKDPNVRGRWSASVGGIDFTSADDIAVDYWMGTRTTSGCDFETPLKAHVPEAPIDYINVYDDDTPGNGTAPLLHRFALTPGSCGGPGFVYTASLDPLATCTISFTADVDSGGNPAPDSITVASSNPEVTPVTVAGAGGTGVQSYSGQLTFRPNAVDAASAFAQSYTQVGLHKLKVSWEQQTGTVGGVDCSLLPCTGTFEAGAPSGGGGGSEQWQHATYVTDPLRSSPLMRAELTNGSGTPIPNSYPADGPNLGAFTIELNNVGVDQQHIFALRDSVQDARNRSHAIDCGQGNADATGLAAAIVLGCKDATGVNGRNDDCATPSSGYRDCVLTVPADPDAVPAAFAARFTCSLPNNWTPGASPGNLTDSDPRYAYVFLTSWGRLIGAAPAGAEIPIRAFARFYVTGWSTPGGGWETCSGDNDPRPLPDDGGGGAALWGHFVDVVTLSDDVIVGDAKCDLTASIVTCKPALVR